MNLNSVKISLVSNKVYLNFRKRRINSKLQTLTFLTSDKCFLNVSSTLNLSTLLNLRCNDFKGMQHFLTFNNKKLSKNFLLFFKN